MSPPSAPPPPATGVPPTTATDRLLTAALIGCTIVVFWPVLRWVVQEVTAREQIRQTFLILAAAAALVGWQQRRRLRLRHDFHNRTLALLATGYLGVALTWFTGWPLLLLPAFTCALAGCLHLLFGVESWRFLRPLLAGLIACLITILLFPLLDWPLRQLAGVNAARLLQALDLAPQLAVLLEPEPKLLLSTGRQVFEVATECNGFGLITTGAVLTLLAGLLSERRLVVVLALIPVAILIGFALNLLRILAICLLAPYFPGHYFAMHEIVGTLALWSALGLVAWLAWKPLEAAPVDATA